MLDTRDLEERRQELEDELDYLNSRLQDAEVALADAEEGDIADAEIDLEQAQKDLDEWVEGYQDELRALNSLRDEFDHRSWRDGITLIPERDFKNYAMDLAEDIHGSISGWPFDCIDWDQAADALSVDYSSVEYEGETYLYRE